MMCKTASRPRRGLLRRVSVVAIALALPLSAAACGESGSGQAKVTDEAGVTISRPVAVSTTVPANTAYTATVKTTVPKISVYDTPASTSPSRVLDNPWQVDPDYPEALVPQVFLVKQQREDGWVQVLLPVRPNGSRGWVKGADVTVSPNPYHIEVSLGQHTITVSRGTQQIYQGKVAVGAPETPTPTGEYYLRVLVKAIDPTTVYGPYAYGLSSHSDTLETFNGGDAEIGIHGNNDASVLGSDVTHGCIRIDNDAITMLAKQLPLGTPVEVTA
jgi:lipoprotein-anchoring transpeptidase ErfK/SrfK